MLHDVGHGFIMTVRSHCKLGLVEELSLFGKFEYAFAHVESLLKILNRNASHQLVFLFHIDSFAVTIAAV